MQLLNEVFRKINMNEKYRSKLRAVYVDEDLHCAVRNLADTEGRQISYVVSKALKDYLERLEDERKSTRVQNIL